METIDTDNGVDPTHELQPEGTDLHYDTAFDYMDTFVDTALKSKIIFPSAQYKREGYDYLGLYA